MWRCQSIQRPHLTQPIKASLCIRCLISVLTTPSESMHTLSLYTVPVFYSILCSPIHTFYILRSCMKVMSALHTHTIPLLQLKWHVLHGIDRWFGLHTVKTQWFSLSNVFICGCKCVHHRQQLHCDSINPWLGGDSHWKALGLWHARSLTLMAQSMVLKVKWYITFCIYIFLLCTT